MWSTEDTTHNTHNTQHTHTQHTTHNDTNNNSHKPPSAYNKNKQGTYKYNDTFSYTGDWVDGVKHGFGALTLSDGSSYVGEFANNEIDGCGVRTFADGGTYDGQFVGGEPHGRGEYRRSDAVHYTGGFQHGQRNGVGELLDNGDTYTGTFVANRRDGQGRANYRDGSSYKGEWANGAFHGSGRHETAGGDVYDGEWQCGRRHGVGRYRHQRTGVTFNGAWCDGVRQPRLARLRLMVPRPPPVDEAIINAAAAAAAAASAKSKRGKGKSSAPVTAAAVAAAAAAAAAASKREAAAATPMPAIVVVVDGVELVDLHDALTMERLRRGDGDGSGDNDDDEAANLKVEPGEALPPLYVCFVDAAGALIEGESGRRVRVRVADASLPVDSDHETTKAKKGREKAAKAVEGVPLRVALCTCPSLGLGAPPASAAAVSAETEADEPLAAGDANADVVAPRRCIGACAPHLIESDANAAEVAAARGKKNKGKNRVVPTPSPLVSSDSPQSVDAGPVVVTRVSDSGYVCLHDLRISAHTTQWRRYSLTISDATENVAIEVSLDNMSALSAPGDGAAAPVDCAFTVVPSPADEKKARKSK
jgi:hypothetical protein